MTETIPVTINLDAVTKQRIDALKIHGFTLSGFIRAAVEQHLKLFPADVDPESIARLISRA